MFKSKKMVGNDVIHDSNDVVHGETKRGGAGALSVLLSLAALFLSAVSLYQTVLKQANLNMFVPETISYTRDAEGNYEVFILPLTITNSGARDGVVSALKLVGTNQKTGQTVVFKASYFAKAEYFIPPAAGAQTKLVQRPKQPFSPIAVSGFSGFGGTLLFYPDKRTKETFMSGEGEYDFVLTSKTKATDSHSFLDNLWSMENKPVRFTAVSKKVMGYFGGWIVSGNTWRMSVKD